MSNLSDVEEDDVSVINVSKNNIISHHYQDHSFIYLSISGTFTSLFL